jgi:pilus assembly protein CpaF
LGQTYFEEEFAIRTADIAVVGRDPYQEGLAMVRRRLTETFTPDQLTSAGPRVTDEATRLANQVYISYNDQALRENRERIPVEPDMFVSRALADLLGMGPLEPLLEDETVEDIAVNGPDEVMVYRSGRWEATDIRFESAERLLEMLNRGIADSNRQANMVMPIADAVLPGKERIGVVTHPIATPWPAAVIRIPRASNINLEDMVQPNGNAEEKVDEESQIPDYSTLLDGKMGGMLSPDAAVYLHGAVLAGLNIVAVGPTGSGKTTLLMALGRKIPRGKRVLIIEDTPEIVLHPDEKKPNNVLYLRTRPVSLEGVPPINQEDLVKLALRHRPDALTLGEARGAEVFDLLNALNTGHKNGLTSIHAYGVEEFFGRIFLMLAQSERGRFLDTWRAAHMVASTLDIAVSLEVTRNNGRTVRRVRTIAELTGEVVQKGGTYEPEMHALYRHNGRKLDGPLKASVHAAALREVGVVEVVIEPS